LNIISSGTATDENVSTMGDAVSGTADDEVSAATGNELSGIAGVKDFVIGEGDIAMGDGVGDWVQSVDETPGWISFE
jgi:hypothetical protein